MGADLRNDGTIMLVDRATRAIADRLELELEPAIVAEWLGRAPDVDGEGILAWGRLTSAQILELFDLVGDAPGAEIWRDKVAKHAARDLFISAVWRTRA